MLDVIDPTCPPSTLLSNLVSSPTSPLYTALVVFSPCTRLASTLPTETYLFLFLALSPRDRAIVDGLGAHIPVVLLPAGPRSLRLPVSAFRPSSTHALRAGIFHSPETLSLLRGEAAERFLRWREVERAVRSVRESRTDARSQNSVAWDKAAWETEWDATLSRDVARRLREGTITAGSSGYIPAKSTLCSPVVLDPFYIPSLVMFSLSLFAPLKDSISQLSLSGRRLGVVLVGTLCAGVGVGLALRAGY